MNERDISQPETVRELLEATGHDATAIMAAATSQEIVAAMAENTDAAIAAGAVGAPAYVLAGEPFWGQDRIDYLDHALSTRRSPFTAG